MSVFASEFVFANFASYVCAPMGLNQDAIRKFADFVVGADFQIDLKEDQRRHTNTGIFVEDYPLDRYLTGLFIDFGLRYFSKNERLAVFITKMLPVFIRSSLYREHKTVSDYSIDEASASALEIMFDASENRKIVQIVGECEPVFSGGSRMMKIAIREETNSLGGITLREREVEVWQVNTTGGIIEFCGSDDVIKAINNECGSGNWIRFAVDKFGIMRRHQRDWKVANKFFPAVSTAVRADTECEFGRRVNEPAAMELQENLIQSSKRQFGDFAFKCHAALYAEMEKEELDILEFGGASGNARHLFDGLLEVWNGKRTASIRRHAAAIIMRIAIEDYPNLANSIISKSGEGQIF